MSELTADYVIVGSGAGGSVLAERLSQDPSVQVIVLEAGGSDRSPVHKIPKGFYFTIGNPKYAKFFRTQPYGTHGNVDAWMRGRIVGGSTSINGLVWNRGWKPDFDAIEAAGNPGWNWDGFLQAYREIEDYEPGASTIHGQGGPAGVQLSRPTDPVTDMFLASAAAAGAEQVQDVNGSDGQRAGYAQNSTKHGVRVSAASAYLRPALKRPNVHLVTKAEVGTILWDGIRARGVLARRGSEKIAVLANKEVLVCGGSLDSPLLLERSGIGSGDVLARAGVRQVIDSPNVGERLQEQRGDALMFNITGAEGFNSQLSSTPRYLATGAKYLATHTGVVAQGAASASVFFTVDPNSDRPDAYGQFSPVSTKTDEIDSKLEPEDTPGVMLQYYPLRPTSRGSIHIAGDDPAIPPFVDPQYATSEYDRTILSRLTLRARELFASGPLAEHIVGETTPGPAVTDGPSALQHAIDSGGFYGHPLSTCAMGPDDEDVVDADLRVRGAEGLRVVDASVFMVQPSGNTSAPTQALAWQAARRIQDQN